MPCHVDGAIACVFNASTVQCALAKTAQCPSCNKSYVDVLLGPQPSGAMTVRRDGGTSCRGYASVPALVVDFSFDSGVQTERMPEPGARYCGRRVTCYYPDTPHGREAVSLLCEAFKLGVAFRVGDSLTTVRRLDFWRA